MTASTGLPRHLQRYADAGLWEDMTLGDHARARAQAEPDTVVFLTDPNQPTYASLLAEGEALARSLIELGLRPGDVIIAGAAVCRDWPR